MPHQTRRPQRNWGRGVTHPHPGPGGPRPLSASVLPGCGRQLCLFSKCPILFWVAGGGVKAQAGVSRGWG